MTEERSATKLDIRDGYAILTLNAPDKRNALTGEPMISELIAAFEHPPGGTRVLIVTGAGTAFSAGGNVKEMAERTGMFGGHPDEIAETYRTSVQRLTRAVASTDVVTIAAVNGPAVGAGFDLALGCDLRFASTNAWFAHTFVDLGIIPGDGGLWLLTRIVGHQRAAEISFTGRRIEASEAVDLDVLLDVVEPDALLDRCAALAEMIAAKPAHSIRLTKRLLRHARSMDLDGFLELTAAVQALSHANPEHSEAMNRYLARLKKRT